MRRGWWTGRSTLGVKLHTYICTYSMCIEKTMPKTLEIGAIRNMFIFIVFVLHLLCFYERMHTNPYTTTKQCWGQTLRNTQTYTHMYLSQLIHLRRLLAYLECLTLRCGLCLFVFFMNNFPFNCRYCWMSVVVITVAALSFGVYVYICGRVIKNA